MNARRQLASLSALGLLVVLAFGSEVPKTRARPYPTRSPSLAPPLPSQPPAHPR